MRDRRYRSPKCRHGLRAAPIYREIAAKEEAIRQSEIHSHRRFPHASLAAIRHNEREIQPAYGDDIANVLQVLDLVVTIGHEGGRTLRFYVDVHLHRV